MANVYVPEPGVYIQTAASAEHPGGTVRFLPPGWSELDPALESHAIVSRLTEQSDARALADVLSGRDKVFGEAMVKYYAESIALQDAQLETMRKNEDERAAKVNADMLAAEAYEETLTVDPDALRAITISMTPDQHMMVSAAGMAGKYPEFEPPEPAVTAPPEVVDTPYVSGDGVVGATLTCTMGNWNNTPSSYAYQWKSGATDVGTGTASYVVADSDNGNNITCVVTATNALGSTEAPPSNPVTVGAGTSTASTEGSTRGGSRRTTV
jgi:hypothetical protein